MSTEPNPLPRMLRPRDLSNLPGSNGPIQPAGQGGGAGYEPPEVRERLHKLAEEIDRKPLTEIAYRLAHLTFGDMVEFSKGINAEPAAVWDWATTNRG